MKTISQICFILACVLKMTLFVSVASAQDAPPVYRKVCNGRQCWFERIPVAPIFSVAPVSVAPVSDPRIDLLSQKIDRLAAAMQRSEVVPEAGYRTFTVEPAMSASEYQTFTVEPASSDPLATGEAAHTPMSEVVRVLALLPKPEIAFIDFGCGYDARWCIAAAERWGCKCVGIEIDPSRAAAARERVRNLGLSHLITIVEGDAAVVPVSGDVAVAYLYSDVLARLKPRLEGYRAVASYLHQFPGMSGTKSGDTWIYRRQQVQQAQQVQLSQSGGAVWGGVTYSQRVCNNPHCQMCNSIGRQLGYR